MGWLKAFLPIALLAALLLMISPAPAAAATPCWKVVINDWWSGGINNTYPIHCYREAIEKLPAEAKDYSGAPDDIRRAMLEAIRNQREGFEDYETAGSTFGGPGGGEPPRGFFARLLDMIAPGDADSIPVPLLVLAAIAFLLLGAAGASYVARWIQARRMQFPPLGDSQP